MEINGKVYRNLEGQVGYLTDKYDDLQNQINDVRAHLTHYVEVDQLPTGDDIDPSAVYLLGPMGTAPDQYYEEWVYVQKADESWVWEKLGDTDSVDLSGYLEKQTGTSAYNQIYAKTSGGEQTMLNVYSAGTDASTVAMRDSYGRINCANPGTGVGDGINAVNKQYADATYLAKNTVATTYAQAYVKNAGGTQGLTDIAVYTVPDTIVKRDGGGGICGRSIVPSDASDLVTNKGYVDTYFLAKDTSGSTYGKAYIKNTDGSQGMANVTANTEGGAIVMRTLAGQVNVPATPTDNTNAASKQYVDAAVGQLLYLHVINLVFTIDASNYLIVRAHLVSGSSTAITSLTRQQFSRMTVEYGSYGTSNNASDVSANAICSVTKLPGSFRFDDFTEPYIGFLYQYVSGSTLLWGVADNTMTVTVTDVVVSF